MQKTFMQYTNARAAAKEYSAKISDVLQCIDGPIRTPTQLLVLETLLDGPLDPTDISLNTDTKAPSISRMLPNLVKAGVINVTQSEADKRSRTVRLTQKGRKAVKKVLSYDY